MRTGGTNNLLERWGGPAHRVDRSSFPATFDLAPRARSRENRNVFTIGAFAGFSGISAKALRLYDRMVLFRPAWTDGATGYRYYSAAQLPELRRIVALRDTGM